jgi:hypothetical protein
MGAVILFISYYVFALPVGISLTFATGLGITGESPVRMTGIVVERGSRLTFNRSSIDWMLCTLLTFLRIRFENI